MKARHDQGRSLPRLFAAAVLCAMLLGAFASAIPVSAAGMEPQISAASYSSPALCTDSGTTVDLAACSVQFEQGGELVAGAAITWRDGEKKVTSLEAAKPGVYPLTAEYGSLSRTVYVVAKDPSESEYVLYYDNFSSDTTTDLRVLQQSKGATITHNAVEGTLVLNSSNASGSYIRVLLPEFLDDFGDAVYTACYMLSDPCESSTRWGAMVYRRQKDTSLFMQLAMRYNSTLSNGLEVALRNTEGGWDVLKTGNTKVSCANSYNTVTASFVGPTTDFIINGNTVMTYDRTSFAEGGMGFQTRGITMSVDFVKICVNPKSSPDADKHPGRYADTAEKETGISMAPSIVSEVRSAADLERVMTELPAVALLPLSGSGGKLAVELSGTQTDPDSVFALFDRKVIPAFRVNDGATAVALGQYLKDRGYRDAFIVSRDPEVIAAARAVWSYPYGVLDASGSTDDDLTLQHTATAAGCRVIIMDESRLTRGSVDAIQSRYLAIWTAPGDGAAATASAVNRGVMGLITGDAASVAETLGRYYTDDHTLVRTVHFISHRGMTWLHQENSVEGLLDAFSFGATMVETDVHLSADGVIIIMHDTTIDRTTDGTGTISAMTAEEILSHKLVYNSLAEPENIPTLEDLFKAFADSDRRIVIEYKPTSTRLVEPLAGMIRKYGMEDRVMVISFYPAMLSSFHEIMPEVPVAWLASSVTPDPDDAITTVVDLASILQQSDVAFTPPYSPINTDSVRDLFVRGFSAWLWTVNDLVRLDRYICAGYAGITGNNPQWVTRYYMELASGREDGRLRISGSMYGGEVYDLTSASEAVILESSVKGTEWDPATGTFYGDGDGTARVFFKYRASTVSRQQYTLVTEVITVDVAARSAGPQSGAGDETSPASPEQTPGEASTPADETAGSSGKGCGSSSSALPSVMVLAAVCLCAAMTVRQPDGDVPAGRSPDDDSDAAQVHAGSPQISASAGRQDTAVPELAYLGDAVMELFIRERLVRHGGCGSAALNRAALSYVSATAQSAAVDRIAPLLTPEEAALYRLGRNAGHGRNTPKSATVAEYRRATGLEVLFGKLYLDRDLARIGELLDAAYPDLAENDSAHRDPAKKSGS